MMKGKPALPKLEVIDEFPDETSPVLMEGCANDEHEDSKKHYLIYKNDTKVTDEVREISTDT